MEKEQKDEHLWNQLVKLGDMMGDGLHYEEPWISKEYKKISKILIPEIALAEKERRKQKNKKVDEAMERLSRKITCKKDGCGGELKQSRSGSKIAYCKICNARYKAK